MVLFSQYLRNVHVPICAYRRRRRNDDKSEGGEDGGESAEAVGCTWGKMPFFKLFPVGQLLFF